MSSTVADQLLERLSQWGVKRVFGYPGDGINGIMGAMGRRAEAFDYIRVRHEEMAAFMAGAHAKFTGEVGVCLATSGPGAIHLLNGLYDARMDHQPVLAIVGQQAATALGSDYQQEVDLQSLFKDVSAYVETVVSPAQLLHVLDRALRVAVGERQVATVIVPNDVQQMAAPKRQPHEHGHVMSAVGFVQPRPYARDADLEAAAAILNRGRRVAILAGAGALGAHRQLEAVAERLAAGVAKALLGKAAVSDDLPYVTGSIGLLGTRASSMLMEHCDTLLIVGSTFPYSEFLPKAGQARAVQIDLYPRNIGIRYPIDQALLGDAGETLERLLPLLEQKKHGAWRRRVERAVTASREEARRQAEEPADPINPQRVFRSLSEQLPDDAILCGDSGSHTNWYARDIRMRPGMLGSLSGKLATMGSGVPYAIAAKLAYPQRPVVAMVGDGAMQMNGNAELVTVQQYWQRWDSPTFIVLVLNNGDLNQVTWEQRALAGDPEFSPAQEVIDFPYARYADMLGFKGIRVDRPEDIDAAWAEAFAADRPVLLEVVTDPNVPPLPPHISFEQATHLLGAMLQDDPKRWGVIRQSARQVLARH
ncbi:thiamine pyrophosphate-requiring protein [Pseudomonas aeruginosa]|uniref:thiamine pyrophosphate-requiring protein n=1 Tax=Pseudomonas aeruginosa TaxID=287 RepID=UPI0023AA06C0|nr:thiamine pyrophosphate-requiring protein [Pseudomonas aeruginosa]MDE5048281.1 thiamine pyrophosphate-requiring protein [Pseudomonas aeruginosa]